MMGDKIAILSLGTGTDRTEPMGLTATNTHCFWVPLPRL